MEKEVSDVIVRQMKIKQVLNLYLFQRRVQLHTITFNYVLICKKAHPPLPRFRRL